MIIFFLLFTWFFSIQVVNPKLSEIASRFGNSFGNKGRWGYNGGFRGRENAGPRSHQRFGNAPMNRFKNNSNNYGNNGGKLFFKNDNFLFLN